MLDLDQFFAIDDINPVFAERHLQFARGAGIELLELSMKGRFHGGEMGGASLRGVERMSGR